MPTIHINGKKIDFDSEEKTILDVARQAGVYIPTLCDHEELENYGGCRMCIVEVEGMRGFPPSCTTAAKDGMVVKTETDGLMELKRNIMQLLLMEHPSACMVCFEWPDCLKYRTESHKAGAVTGCNTCPNRDMCELREVVEFLEVRDLDFDPHYKSVPIERNDPFFDRDYNLCILCARCVRVCDEVRGTAAITFAKRGHETRVDTAFGTSHVDSGCMFCGACIDVCPTGALYPRMSKWLGTPDSEETTTCVLCGVGCQTRLDIKWSRIMGSGPGDRKLGPNHGHMCVLGRFCIPSIVNAPDRIKMPYIKNEGNYIPSSWEDVVSLVAEILAKANPERVGFLGGPHMTSEAAYLFGRLARAGAKTANVDFLGSDFAALIHKELAAEQDFNRIGSLDDLESADWILSLGGDFVKTHQVAAKRVYAEISKGTPLVVLDEVGLNLQRWARQIVRVGPKKLGPLLSALVERKKSLPNVKDEQATRMIEIISEGKGAILIGQRILEASEPRQILRNLVTLAGNEGVLFPLLPLGNEAGVIRAGLRPEMLPGPASVTGKEARNATEKRWGKSNLDDGFGLAEMRDKAKKKQLDVLYVTDGSIPVDGFEKVPTIIYQSPYPSKWMDLAKVVLPSSAFTEENGTFVNLEMKPMKLKQIVKAPGTAREDWLIFKDIGQQLGAERAAWLSPWRLLRRNRGPLRIGARSRWRYALPRRGR